MASSTASNWSRWAIRAKVRQLVSFSLFSSLFCFFLISHSILSLSLDHYLSPDAVPESVRRGSSAPPQNASAITATPSYTINVGSNVAHPDKGTASTGSVVEPIEPTPSSVAPATSTRTHNRFFFVSFYLYYFDSLFVRHYSAPSSCRSYRRLTNITATRPRYKTFAN